MIPQLYRLLLRQKYPKSAAREFLETVKECPESENVISTLKLYFESQKQVRDLQAAHFPTMTLSGQELVKRVANHVGLQPPKQAE